jgi:hypothetical protein
MQYTILLDKHEDTKDIERQEQARFIKTILDALEVNIEWDPNEPLTIESKLKLRQSLETYNIDVLNDTDGGIKVFANKDLIGDWSKPYYVLKQDYSQIDPDKKLYLEMHVNFWTIFE